MTCTLIFGVQLALPPQASWRLVYGFGATPAALFGRTPPLGPAWLPPELTLITYQFLHGGWGHLLPNMLLLWIFGPTVERAMGHGRFLLFYLFCGGAAALLQALLEPAAQVTMIGASGAVAGLLAAHWLLYPYARIPLRPWPGAGGRIFYLPAAWVISGWLALQAVGAAWSGRADIGWLAHLGGFVTGLALTPLCRRRSASLFSRERLPPGG